MNKTPLQSWEYRAYNCNNQMVKGHEKASNFQHLAIILRQQSLQVMDATLVSPDQNVAEDRLTKMKRRLQPQEPEKLRHEQKTTRCSIRGWISSVISLLRRG